MSPIICYKLFSCDHGVNVTLIYNTLVFRNIWSTIFSYSNYVLQPERTFKYTSQDSIHFCVTSLQVQSYDTKMSQVIKVVH